MARKTKGRRTGRAKKKKPEQEDAGGEPRRPRPAYRRPIPVAVFGLVVLIAAAIVWATTSSNGGDGDQRGTSLAIAQLPAGPSARLALPPMEGAAPRADRAAETASGRTAALPPSEAPREPARTARADEGSRAALARDETESAQPDSATAKLSEATQAGNGGAEDSRAGDSGSEDIRAAAPARDETVTAALPETRARALPAEPRDGLVLAPAPDPELVTEGQDGLLPVIAPDGRRAWQVYARPFEKTGKRPRIAIMLAGLGLSQSATKAAIQQLPGAVTLGFAPYARGLEAWMDEARAAGHEVFLELPMEPFDYPNSDPGPHTLLTTLDPSDNIDRLDWLLSRTAGYVGVTNFMGDKFTSSPESLGPVLEALRNRGLMFLDARTSRDSVAGELATQIKLPRALNNRFLDNEASRIAIDARLLELEEIAKTVGYAVGIGFPYPVTLERIARWSATLDEKGIDLAPMSALADLQSE